MRPILITGRLYVVSVAGSSIGETPGITTTQATGAVRQSNEGWIRIDTLAVAVAVVESLGDLLDVTLTEKRPVSLFSCRPINGKR